MKPMLPPKQLVLASMLMYGLTGMAQHEISRLLSLDVAVKADSISAWYFNKGRSVDSTYSVGSLRLMAGISAKNNDYIGQAAATFFEGQYTAVKLGRHEQGLLMMEKGIALADKHGNTLQAAQYRHHMGYFYYSGLSNYSKALQYMLTADIVFRDHGYDNIMGQDYNLYRLAFVYYHLGNYHESLKHLGNAFKCPGNVGYVRLFIVNTIGQCYRKLKQYDSANIYFHHTRRLAVHYDEEPWIGIASGNIGFVYIHQGDFRTARPFFNEYLKYSINAKDTVCISEALTAIADIDIEQKDYPAAKERLTTAEDLLYRVFESEERSNGYVAKENYVRQLYLLNTFGKLYERTNQQPQALTYLTKARTVRDSLDRRALLSGYIAVQQQIEAEQHLRDLSLLEKQKQNEVLKQYIIAGTALFAIVILFMAYKGQRLKRTKERELQQKKDELLAAEKNLVQSELQHARDLLENYTASLKQKSELLEQVQSEISVLRNLHGDDQTPQILYLNALSHSTILTEQDWNNFTELFEKVHTGFFVKLKEKYPHITPAETRLLSLTKLHLSTKEMACMLGISADSIKKTRQRLRRKMELEEERNLEELVASL